MTVPPGFFVTGTDTGVGKTHVTAGLVRALRDDGTRAIAMKPVASGCVDTPDGPRNDDALALIAAMGDDAPPYAAVNPVALREAIAPHVAAQREQRTILLPPLVAAYRLLADDAAAMFVEGVGGWMVPLSATRMQADLARACALPVLLVVGVRLGAISHALMTARAIRADRVPFAGWIANRIDPAMPAADETIAAIAARIDAPLVADLPHGAGTADFAAAATTLASFLRAQLSARRAAR